LALHQLAREGDALLGIALVVAHHQLELASAEHTTVAVDLVDGDLEAALDGLAGGGRAAGDGGGEPDLHGLLDWARTRPGPVAARNRMSIRERRRMRILLGGS